MLLPLPKSAAPNGNIRNIFYATLLLWSVGVLLLCGLYFTVGINVWTSWVAVILFATVLVFRRRDLPIPPKRRVKQLIPETKTGIALTGIAIFCFLTILLIAIQARTGAAVISPWNILPTAIFTLYGIGLFCTMLVARIEENHAALPLGMLFTFTSTSIASIVYTHGFGFDPFLHRAAETALVADGFIKPLQILYSGQYSLVAALHHITQLPIKWIDIWLVPILASWFLPLGITIGLQDGWGLSRRDAYTWWPVIFLIPFSLITFTVPFTVTYVFFFLFCALWPTRHPILTLTLFAAIFFHPLLAVPMFLFTFIPLLGGAKGVARAATRRTLTLLALAVSVPAMLIVSHTSPAAPHLSSLLEHRELFFNLFRSPYWDPYPFIPWTLQALYGFRYWTPMILFVGLLFYCTSTMKHLGERSRAVDAWIFVLGMTLTIWGTSTLFSFKDIIVHEQAEFALRLLQALFTFPLVMLAVPLAAMTHRWRWTAIPAMGLVAACVTISWFFSYPQFNLKYPFFSPSVSDDDIAAVHDIDNRFPDESYIVLVHQMTSAAAVQEFGFSQMVMLDGEEILRYPIPTGGKLYPYYEDLLYNGVMREKLDALQKKSGVKHIYVVTHDYWSWSQDMLQSLADSADDHFREPELTVWTFDY